jgi:hypothetical protein
MIARDGRDHERHRVPRFIGRHGRVPRGVNRFRRIARQQISSAQATVVAGMAADVFDAHMAEHAALLGRFEEIKQTPLETLGDTLKSWFVDHAIRQDSHLKTIFQAM